MKVIPAATASGAGVPYREYGERVVGSGSGARPDGSGGASFTPCDPIPRAAVTKATITGGCHRAPELQRSNACAAAQP